MSLRRCALSLAFVVVSALFLSTSSYAGVHFQPVSPEELKMTSEPLAPGAPAIILFREVQRDDCGITCNNTSASLMSIDRFEENYVRIKILNEAGRKYGNVEIPLFKEVGTVDGISARSIRPDGTIVNFTGQAFVKTIVKAKGYQYLAKTFVIPDVQVGSVIEYYYTINFVKGAIFFSDWILSEELFTKNAKFTLRPFQSNYYTLNFRWSEHLPTGMPSPKQLATGNVELEATNIAAVPIEDFMPPENELKARVDFIYSADPFDSDANKFWRKVGKKRNDQLESFVSRRGALNQALSAIVAPTDTPEAKLQKIYTRVQQLRNTSYEIRKTDQELQRENRKDGDNVEEIWKQGEGTETQLNWLFLALARAAGFDASGVWVPSRRTHFFYPGAMQSGSLDRNAVLVKLNGKEMYFAPGTSFTPFGMLPWEESGVQGLRLDRDGGTWVQTTLPESSASQVQRKAELKLTPDGSVDGKLMVSFTGLEAQNRRMDQRNEDEASRKVFLENEVKQYVPAASELALTNQPDWRSSDAPLVAQFNISIPGWATVSGRRALFPLGMFGGTERHVFEYSQRTHPIYFEFLSSRTDDITVELPPQWQVTSVPKPQNQELRVVGYAVAADNSKGTLHLTRKLDINILSLEQKYYGPLRSFFQIVKAGDEQQAVLLPSTATSSN